MLLTNFIQFTVIGLLYIFLCTLAIEFKTDEDCVKWMKSQDPFLANRYTDEQLKSTCAKHSHWTAGVAKGRAARKVLTDKQIRYVNQVRKCRTVSECFPDAQPYLPEGIQTRGPKNISRVTRKEIRAISDEERKRYFDALNVLKDTSIDGVPMYNLLVYDHQPEMAPEAHWGCAFPPYHRELLKTLEVALRQIDSSVFIPYWNSAMDRALPTPCDSIIWTEEFAGNGKGYLTTGPFSKWKAVTPWKEGSNDLRIFRDCGAIPDGEGYTEQDFDHFKAFQNYSQLCFCNDPSFETAHGLVHDFVGGHMSVIPHSPNDPIFFSHHCFVDYLWEYFRTSRQSRDQRETEYPSGPPTTCGKVNDPDQPLSPFEPLIITDGLSNNYTDWFYDYAPRPKCDQGCTGQYLYCDKSKNACISKIRPQGNCTGFEGKDICYKSKCQNGLCS